MNFALMQTKATCKRRVCSGGSFCFLVLEESINVPVFVLVRGA